MLKCTTCRHFTGLFNIKCEKGIAYESVKVASGHEKETPPMYHFAYPCTNYSLPLSDEVMEELQFKCALQDFPSYEEEQADFLAREARLAEWAHKISSNICPTHNKPITPKQVGRCVYAKECGCRLYQGQIRKVKSDNPSL